MKHLYHLSHFFEFLCGVYFGGSTILAFAEEAFTNRFSDPLTAKISDVETARIYASQFDDVILSKKLRDIIFRDILAFFALLFYRVADRYYYKKFTAITKKINRIKEIKSKSIFLKKFFPAFLFNGIFCLLVVLLSGFQYTNTNGPSSNYLDCFLLDFALACIVFQTSALLLFPRFVAVIDYLHLFLFALIFGLGIVVAVALLSINNHMLGANWLLLEENKSWLQLFILTMGLFPLLGLFAYFGRLLFIWEATIFFYWLAAITFGKEANRDLGNDILGL